MHGIQQLLSDRWPSEGLGNLGNQQSNHTFKILHIETTHLCNYVGRCTGQLAFQGFGYQWIECWALKSNVRLQVMYALVVGDDGDKNANWRNAGKEWCTHTSWRKKSIEKKVCSKWTAARYWYKNNKADGQKIPGPRKGPIHRRRDMCNLLHPLVNLA